jgi:hypothetical protein
VVAANLVVAEATLCDPSCVIIVQLERSLARVQDPEQKCAGICEDIRDAQEQTKANETHIEASCTSDATRANVAGVAIMRQMACYEIGLRPPAVGALGPVGPGPAQRIICKPEKDLNPQELTADMTPVEFAYWVDAFEAYHAGSHMEVAPIAVQQAFFKACVHSVLYNRIKSNIVSGVTPVLGQGNTVMELMRDEFLLEH